MNRQTFEYITHDLYILLDRYVSNSRLDSMIENNTELKLSITENRINQIQAFYNLQELIKNIGFESTNSTDPLNSIINNNPYIGYYLNILLYVSELYFKDAVDEFNKDNKVNEYIFEPDKKLMFHDMFLPKLYKDFKDHLWKIIIKLSNEFVKELKSYSEIKLALKNMEFKADELFDQLSNLSSEYIHKCLSAESLKSTLDSCNNLFKAMKKYYDFISAHFQTEGYYFGKSWLDKIK